MSIINQVLAQLERRGVWVEQDMVRAVPPQRSVRLLPLLLVALLLAVTVWWLTRGSFDEGAKPQQVAPTVASVLSAMPIQTSGIAAQAPSASRSGVPVATPSAPVAAPAVLAALPQEPKPVLQVPKLAPQPALKPAQQAAPTKPVPQPAPLPKVAASVPPKQSAPATPEKVKSVAAGLPAAQRSVASVPSKPAASAPQPKVATKPSAAPAANKAASPKPHQEKSAAAAVADGGIPMKQISRAQQAEAEFRKGIELMQGGSSNDAMASYQAALQLDSGHDAARQALIALLLEEKRREEAERLLQSRLEERPQHSGFAMLLARLQVERGAPGEAQVTLERSLAYAETRADYQAFLAALQQRNNFHAEAVVHYQAALQLQPGNGAWLMGYGISLQALRRNAEAKAAYQQALDSKSLSADLQAFVQRKLKGL